MTDPNFRIVDAATAGLEALCDGFNRGFRDYKYASYFDPPGMERFLERSAMRLEDCAVLLAEEAGAWKGVGAALLAIEKDEAWCGGLAVDASQRRRGGAWGLMQAIHNHARRGGAHKMLLEVLVQNAAAQALYQRLGYRTRAELLLWERTPTPDHLPSARADLQPADALDLIYDCYDWHPAVLSWQRRRESLIRAYALMDALVLESAACNPMGYALYHHNDFAYSRGGESVHLFDIAVAPGRYAAKHAAELVDALVVQFPTARIVLVNEPVDSIFNPALTAAGFHISDRQYELSREVIGD